MVTKYSTAPGAHGIAGSFRERISKKCYVSSKVGTGPKMMSKLPYLGQDDRLDPVADLTLQVLAGRPVAVQQPVERVDRVFELRSRKPVDQP